MVAFSDDDEYRPIKVSNHAVNRFLTRAGGGFHGYDSLNKVKEAIVKGIEENGTLVKVEHHPVDGVTRVYEWMGLHFPLIKKTHYDGSPIWLIKTTLLKGVFDE